MGFPFFPLSLEEWSFYLLHLRDQVVGARWQNTSTDGVDLVVLDFFYWKTHY